MPTHKIHYSAAPIGSIENLAKALDFTPLFLRKVAADPTKFYTIFQKTVKQKQRTLCEPLPVLKILQKRIISRIFCHIEFPNYLHGGIKTEEGRDFVSNASAHAKCETALTLDIRNFFPSITIEHVEHVFKNLFNFPPDVSILLAKITTLKGAVPQGAPTSSYIANLVMWEKEYKLVAKLQGRGLIYSRLIDDMTISSVKRIPEKIVTRVVDEVASMLATYSFSLHPEKKNIFSRSDPKNLMMITGLWMNRGDPRLLKQKRGEIAQNVATVEQQAKQVNAVYDMRYHKIHSAASGRVALLQRLGHSRALRLRKILQKNEPKFDVDECNKIKILVKKFCAKKMDSTKLNFLENFYRYQYKISIVKRTDPKLAKELQVMLNKKRPKTTMRDLYA